MAKLGFLLALAHTTLIYGLPFSEERRDETLTKRLIAVTEPEVTTSYTSTPDAFQSASITLDPSITGSIHTALPSNGAITQDPLGPSFTKPTVTLAPIDSTLDPGPTAPLGDAGPNIFVPMATDVPPQQITPRGDHAVKKLRIVDRDVPIQTNKFYANFFLGSQSQPVWTHPYSLQWAKGSGDTWGMAVAHVERKQFAVDNENNPPRYFIAPSGIQNIVLSAWEFGEETVMSTEDLQAFSVYANFAPARGAKAIMSIPCVQGMGFVTAIYNGATPLLNSGTYFRTLEFQARINGGVTFKYKITLNDESEWLLYVTPLTSVGRPPFELYDSASIYGPENFVGMIQVAKNPAGESGERSYDSSAGAFPVNATISANVQGSEGKYTLQWGKDGVRNQTLLMYGLPHHVESFDGETAAGLTDISLVTTTKGYARAVRADKFTMVESDLPDDIGFSPWSASSRFNKRAESINLADNVIQAVSQIGALELGEDFNRQTRLDSMYYSGKALAKFAGIIYTLQDIARNTELAAAGLPKLKDAFNVFVNNTQPLPLVYDTVWRGVVSSGTYQNGDTGLDFGNALYNDHHFHYGYFVYTAAVIGYLDPAWLEEGTNRAWTNMLVRDFANPSPSDPFFPFQRSFDWFHGHSWAKGLFESGDGKDQESTSEDTFATYALKMWGKVSGDANMEARGNLQLAVQARSLRNYFLLAKDNKVQPASFVPNKVTGILFENKVDHTTYFGGNMEYIQGIHMIPLNPSSAYTRPKEFVVEEWNTYFSRGRVDQVKGGWKGILFGNLALVDPTAAYRFFNGPDFDRNQLDGGASLTWYLAYSAALAQSSGGVASPGIESYEPEKPVEVEKADEEEEYEYYDDSESSDVEGRDSDDEWIYEDDEGTQATDWAPEVEDQKVETDQATQPAKTQW